MDRRRIAWAAVLGCALLGAAGCGDALNDTRDVRGAVRAFLRSCADDEGALAQGSLAPAARDVLVAQAGTAAGCARVLGTTPAAVAAAGAAPVAAVSARNGQGDATVALPTGPSRLELSYGAEGRWLIDGPH